MKQARRTERQERRNKFTEIPQNYLPIWSHSIDYYPSRFCHFVQRFRIRDISDNLRSFAREHPGIDFHPASYLLNTQIMISDHYAVAYSGQNFSFSVYFCIVVLNCLNLYLRWSSWADICTIIVIFKKKEKTWKSARDHTECLKECYYNNDNKNNNKYQTAVATFSSANNK